VIGAGVSGLTSVICLRRLDDRGGFRYGRGRSRRAVFDVEHADVCPAGGDDLPAARVEGAGMEVTPARATPQIAVT
jgi:hypothetical protein